MVSARKQQHLVVTGGPQRDHEAHSNSLGLSVDQNKRLLKCPGQVEKQGSRELPDPVMAPLWLRESTVDLGKAMRASLFSGGGVTLA